MRRHLAIVKATALEMLSEPLSLLTLLAALAIVVLAPAFHYHQFGEATRMARDAGFSALFTCGGVMAVFGAIRSVRQEVESGTLEMALVRPVSRGGFFLAKAFGALAACLVFSSVVFLTALVIVEGAAIGGEIARASGDLARLWGPCFSAGVGIWVLPIVIGAALNRFFRCRFVLSSFVLAAGLSTAAACWVVWRDVELLARLLPAAVLILALLSVLLFSAAAFAVRWRANAAAAAVGIVAALLVPAAGNYYMSDALANGGRVPWDYVGMALLAALPALLLFAAIGIHFTGRRGVA